jgi:hypothetical protein
VATRKTPAPRRAGNTKATVGDRALIRALVRKLESDPEALSLVVQIAEAMAKRSRAPRC